MSATLLTTKAQYLYSHHTTFRKVNLVESTFGSFRQKQIPTITKEDTAGTTLQLKAYIRHCKSKEKAERIAEQSL